MRYSLLHTGGVLESPVTLDEVKLHLRLDGDDEDTLLQAFISTATEKAEAHTERQLMKTTYRLVYDELPVQKWRPGERPPLAVIKLPKAPLVSVESVTYRDEAGVVQTIPPADYAVDTASEPGRVYLHNGWPTVDLTRPGALTINFTAGYPDAASVPASIKAAVLLLVGHLYQNREAAVLEGSTVAYLLQPWQVEGFV